MANHYQNGVARAQQEIANKMECTNMPVWNGFGAQSGASVYWKKEGSAYYIVQQAGAKVVQEGFPSVPRLNDFVASKGWRLKGESSK